MFLGITNTLTGNKMASIVSAMNSTAQTGISALDKAGTMGMNLGNNIGSKVMDMSSSMTSQIGSGAASALDKMGALDKTINAKISSVVGAGTGAVSSAGQKAGNIISAIWKMPSKTNA